MWVFTVAAYLRIIFKYSMVELKTLVKITHFSAKLPTRDLQNTKLGWR
jgi:hypothetical protein